MIIWTYLKTNYSALMNFLPRTFSTIIYELFAYGYPMQSISGPEYATYVSYGHRTDIDYLKAPMGIKVSAYFGK